jgi:hypothetical protein
VNTNKHKWSLIFAERVIKKVLDFPADLECTSFCNFFSELAKVTQEALKLMGLALEVFNKRTKIKFFVLCRLFDLSIYG